MPCSMPSTRLMQVTCCLSICCSRSTAACYPARGWNPMGGRFRSEQNWIGGSAFNPCSAEYVPPPHELVPDLVADLCEFCNDDSLPAVAQAAIAHAQFETIHPFVDGNGRVARAYPSGAASSRRRLAGPPAGIPNSCDLGTRVCRGANSDALSWAGCFSGGSAGSEPLGRAVCRGREAGGRRRRCL